MEPRLIDISQPISPATATWPGDRSVAWTWTARREEGSSVNIGALSMSVHAGTHADAPLHYRDQGDGVGAWPLSHFMGEAFVVDASDGAHRIGPEHLASVPEGCARVLFRTPAGNVGADTWTDHFPAVHPETVRLIGERGGRLIGTDAPSIDAVDSQRLPAHQACADHGIVNLENLDLTSVSTGLYTLIALPLRVEGDGQGADGAPVRAVLIAGEAATYFERSGSPADAPSEDRTPADD